MKSTFPPVGLLFIALFLTSCAGVKPGEVAAVPLAPASATGIPTPPKPASSVGSGSSREETLRADRENKGGIIPYPFTTCAVIRRDYKGAPKYRRVYQNHEVLFCCTPCLNAFDSNPAPYMPRIIAAAEAKARGEEVYSGW